MRFPQLLSSLIVAVAVCVAQDPARMDQVVQSFVDNKQFMGAAAVVKGDQVIFSKGYGMANLEWQVPNSPQTKFRLGSVTKQFTAASILLLEERGKLSVDDPVSKHLPDAPPGWSRITIRHLLTHQSGIPNVTALPEFRDFKRREATVDKTIGRFRDKPLEFEPGTQMKYSNSGYLVLSHIVEKVSGQKWADFLKQNIFSKLDMNDTQPDSNTAVIARRASGYVPRPSGIENADYIHMSIPQGGGDLISTVGDLTRWQRGLYGGKLLKPESLAKMTTPAKDNYGFGVEIHDGPEGRRYSHGGGIEGFNTHLMYFPKDELTVVVLGNLNGQAPGRIAGNLASIAHGQQVVLASERPTVKVPAETLASYVGEYGINPKVSMTVTLDGDQLNVQLTGQSKYPVYAESPTKFFVRAVEAQIEFTKDADGKVTGLVLRQQSGREIKASRT